MFIALFGIIFDGCLLHLYGYVHFHFSYMLSESYVLSKLLSSLRSPFFPSSPFYLVCWARQFWESSPNDERRQVSKEHDGIFTKSSLNGTQVD